MSRNEILDKLGQKPWYQATPFKLRVELANLPANHDGYLEDLASRPDQIGSLKIHRIVGLKRGSFALITLFEVTQPAAEKPYTYEYVSWRHGPSSGAKGLVFIANGEGKPTHFILLRGSKFAVGGDTFDVPGGFAEPTEEGVRGMLARFEEELKEELGAPGIIVKEVHNLGRILTDVGMTNNHPQLFAAVIDASQAEKIGELPNPDPWEITSLGPVIFPVERLLGVIEANDDSYFHILITRSVARGLLPASLFTSP